jgi:hypothetical protein
VLLVVFLRAAKDKGFAHIAVVDPDLLSQFTTDVGEARLSVETRAGKPTAAEHLDYLGIFLAFLLEANVWSVY